MAQGVIEFLEKHADGDLLPFSVIQDTASRFSLSIAEVEAIALENNLLPARYLRNRSMISIVQQLTLLRSKVAVIGCGGLGGYIIEELARLGVGKIVVVDPDIFEEHNLNRQLISSLEMLGEKKVEAAARRVAQINPAVAVESFAVRFNEENSADILDMVDVVADALDNIPDRLILADACKKLTIPLVHGAIAGWSGYVAVQYPDENIIEALYGDKRVAKGAESALGNPSFTPAVIASLEVAEIVKIVLGCKPQITRKYLAVDLYDMEFTAVPFP